jgi:hypothetical protein
MIFCITTLSKVTFGKTTLSNETFCKVTLSKTTLGKMILSIMTLVPTNMSDIQHKRQFSINDTQHQDTRHKMVIGDNQHNRHSA